MSKQSDFKNRKNDFSKAKLFANLAESFFVCPEVLCRPYSVKNFCKTNVYYPCSHYIVNTPCIYF